MTTEPCVIGIDVAQEHLDVAARPSGETWQVPDDDASLATLRTRLTAVHPRLVVLEATGGLETLVSLTLGAANLPVAVVTPRPVREFAKASGRLATTDRLDAQAIAHVAEVLHPEPRPRPDAVARALIARVARRRQGQELLVAERTRRRTALPTVRPHSETVIAGLVEQVATLDAEVATARHERPLWRAKEDLPRGGPGVGPVLTTTLLAGLPELGTLDRPRSAALIGVAPLARDSGKQRGARHIRGGRAEVRAVLSMGTLRVTTGTPVIAACSQRLLTAGKQKQVALTACRHTLLLIRNAMLRDGAIWDATRLVTQPLDQ